jgi:hypothetical protein
MQTLISQVSERRPQLRRESWAKGDKMNSTKKTARIAGLLYLANGMTGFFGIIYVPIRLIVSGNAAEPNSWRWASHSTDSERVVGKPETMRLSP